MINITNINDAAEHDAIKYGVFPITDKIKCKLIK